MNRQEFLVSGKLDFTVSKQTMYTQSDITDYKETPFFATVNNTTGEALGPVRNAYTVKQNSELLDVVLNKIGEGKYNLNESKCGVFNHGRKVYFFIKTTHQSDWGQEKADTYVYALSSHDGSQKLVFGVCNQIHSCSNMFGTLMNDKDKNHIIKHTKSISDIFNPTFFKAIFVAGTGPIPISSGSTPPNPYEIILANGFPFFAFSSFAKISAQAPSFIPDALPAVTTPSFLKAALKPAKVSEVVFGLGCSSISKISIPFLLLISIGRI